MINPTSSHTRADGVCVLIYRKNDGDHLIGFRLFCSAAGSDKKSADITA